jgi:hypothetical protein
MPIVGGVIGFRAGGGGGTSETQVITAVAVEVTPTAVEVAVVPTAISVAVEPAEITLG